MAARLLTWVWIALCLGALVGAQEAPPKKKVPKIGPKHGGLEPQGPSGSTGPGGQAQDPKPETESPPAREEVDDLADLLPPETPRETWDARFLINGLKGWPDDRSRTDADILVSRGEQDLPVLRRTFLEVQVPRLKAALAEILGRLRDDQSYNALVRALETTSGHEHPAVYFRSLFLIDRARAVPDVTRLLEHRITALRNSAEAFLNENLRREESAEVERYLTARKTSVRLRAHRILARVAPLESIEHFIAGLGDDQASIAQLCLERLAEVSDPVILERLAAEARSFPSRRGAYASLALVLREERHGEEILQPSDLARYRPSLLRADPLEAGVAAVVVATLGYRSDDPEHAELLNREAPTALVAALAVRGYYRDYATLAPRIVSRLTLLSGESIGREVPAWVDWWEKQHTQFRARRRLFDVPAADYRHLVLYYFRGDEGGAARPNNLLFRGLELQDSPAVPGEFILSEDQMKRLMARIEGYHLFKRQSASEARTGTFRELRLQLYNLERTWIFPEPLDAEIAALEVELFESAHENRWQRYWDRDAEPSFRAFIEANWSWWREPRSDLDQQRRIKTMILAAYQGLSENVEKLRALDELDSLLADAQVREPGDAVSILFRIRDEVDPERLTRWVDVICHTPETMVFEPLTTYLARLPKGAAGPLLDQVLAAYPVEPVLTLLDSEREALRRAAASALWRFAGVETEERLLGLLDDNDAGVRRGAALSLGQLRSSRALEPLGARLAVSDPVEREAICEALGRIGGEQAKNVLAQASLTGSVADRMAAVHGLGLLAPEVGSAALVDAYVINAGGEAGHLAQRILRNRQDAISTQRLRAQLSADTLSARRAAAVLLGSRGDRDAIPVLIESDRLSVESDTEVREVLTSLTAYAPLVEGASYSLWWNANREKPPAVWIIDALRRENVEVEADVPIRLDGRINPRLVEILMVATEQDWTPLRTLASRTLAELLEVPVPQGGQRGTDSERLRDYWDAMWLQHPDHDV